MPTDSDDSRLVTAAEGALIVNRPSATVRGWMNTGRLRVRKRTRGSVRLCTVADLLRVAAEIAAQKGHAKQLAAQSKTRREATQSAEDIDRLIAAQMAKLPSWWSDATSYERRREAKDEAPILARLRLVRRLGIRTELRGRMG